MQDLEKLIEELQIGAHEIEQERAKAEALFVSIGDGAIVTDEQGHINRINQVALDLLGHTEAELVGQWYPRVIIAVDDTGKAINAISRPITKAFLSGVPVSDTQFYKKKNGEILAVSVTVSPVLLDGRPVGAIEVFRDYSKEFEIDKMKSEFISLASHQLRTPLSSISLNVQLLTSSEDNLTAEQRETLDIITTSIGRMQELISTLLNITRIEAGRIAVTPQPIDVAGLLRDIVAELKPKADEKKQKLELDIKPKKQKATTDSLLLKEAYANLISNAIKYTPDKGTIKVRLQPKDLNILFSIQDNGYGIPRAEQDRLFSKFYRGSNITKKESVGTGLGLYMVKGIVENLGGDIKFESIEDKGTTFFISIPQKGVEAKEGTTTIEPTAS